MQVPVVASFLLLAKYSLPLDSRNHFDPKTSLHTHILLFLILVLDCGPFLKPNARWQRLLILENLPRRYLYQSTINAF